MGRRQYVAHSLSYSFIDIEKLYEKISCLLYPKQSSTLHTPHIKNPSLYWRMGKPLVEAYYKGIIRDEKYKELSKLSTWFIRKFGKEFSLSALEDSYPLYLIYSSFSKVRQALTRREKALLSQLHLTWEHSRILIHVKRYGARPFYENEATNSSWFRSLLKRFINNHFFEKFFIDVNKKKKLRSIQKINVSPFVKSINWCLREIKDIQKR